MITDEASWVSRGFWVDALALFQQRGLAWQLYLAETAEIRRSSGLGLIAPFVSVLVHVIILGSVMALVFGEPVNNFLPFFAVSFPIWQAFSNSVTDAAYSNEKTHRYLDFPRVSGSIVHLVSGLSFVVTLLLRAAAALLVIGAINPHVLTQANYLGAIAGILLLGATLMAWAVPVAYLFDRFRLLRSFLSQMLLAVYIITPVLWQPDRLKSHRWIIDWNPAFYLMELARKPVLEGGLPWLSLAVSLGLILTGILMSWLLFAANRRLVIYQWMA
jgi:lipopolysaccharide transport system permease protein